MYGTGFLIKADAGVHLWAKCTQHRLGKKYSPTQSFCPDGLRLSVSSQDFRVSSSGWNHHAVNPLGLTRRLVFQGTHTLQCTYPASMEDIGTLLERLTPHTVQSCVADSSKSDPAGKQVLLSRYNSHTYRQGLAKESDNPHSTWALFPA